MTQTNAHAPEGVSGIPPKALVPCKFEKVRLYGLPPGKAEVEQLMKRLSRCECCESGVRVIGV